MRLIHSNRTLTLDFLYNRQNAQQDNFSFDFSDRVKKSQNDKKPVVETTRLTQSRGKSASLPVTRPEDIEFVGQRKSIRKSARPQNKVNYLKNSKAKVRSKNKSSMSFLTKAGWAIACVLFLRLLFMQNGVYDYYHMESVLESRAHELEMVEKENISLVEEIHKIKTSPSYQKALAREHLGVIEANEFLILFAKD